MPCFRKEASSPHSPNYNSAWPCYKSCSALSSEAFYNIHPNLPLLNCKRRPIRINVVTPRPQSILGSILRKTRPKLTYEVYACGSAAVRLWQMSARPKDLSGQRSQRNRHVLVEEPPAVAAGVTRLTLPPNKARPGIWQQPSRPSGPVPSPLFMFP